MPVNFLVRNMPQIQGQDPYLAEALQDLIQQVSAQAQTITSLQQSISDLQNLITGIQNSLSMAVIKT